MWLEVLVVMAIVLNLRFLAAAAEERQEDKRHAPTLLPGGVRVDPTYVLLANTGIATRVRSERGLRCVVRVLVSV